MISIFEREKLKRKCNKLLAKHAFQDVLDLTSEPLSRFTKDVHLRIYRIWSLVELNRQEEALTEVNTALELFPEDLVLMNLRGEIYYKMEDYASALLDLEKAYQIEPDNLYTCYTLGQIAVAKNDLEGASRYFEPILQYDPKLLQTRMLVLAERFIFERKNPSS